MSDYRFEHGEDPLALADVLILLPKSEMADDHEGIERFLAFLWDIGLEVGHSVRTIDDCQRESAADVSVATTLIEARLLSGPRRWAMSRPAAKPLSSRKAARSDCSVILRRSRQAHARTPGTVTGLSTRYSAALQPARALQTCLRNRSRTGRDCVLLNAIRARQDSHWAKP